MLVSLRLSRPSRRLGLSFALLLAALCVPLGLVAAFDAMMCSSETTAQGRIPGRDLVWSIERRGCGATTAGVYTLRLGPHAWWSYTILTADAFPVPRSVEAAGDDAVRIVIDPDSAGEGAPAGGQVVPVTASDKPDEPLRFDRGVKL
ncbi:hypothetical protein ACFSM9_28650 [Microvirga arabica]|uniref:Uncharacterized protein n=1 Tax=Microvirga arabica TaxID=1128671 RepID=A0ABV6Y2G0_9HYPH